MRIKTLQLGGIFCVGLLLAGCWAPRVPSANPDLKVDSSPSGGKVVVKNADFVVTLPAPEQPLRSPQTVEVRAVAAISAVHVRLADDANRLLAEADLTTTGLIFSGQLTYKRPLTLAGTLTVAPTGGSAGSLSIPVSFAEYDDQDVLLYFLNTKLDPNVTDCSKVSAVKRKLNGHAGPAQIIDTLLAGPTQEEKAAGYITQIPEGVHNIGLGIGPNTAQADFTKELDVQGGACRVIAIRAQIEQTLMQFGGVEKVNISANGESQFILQP